MLAGTCGSPRTGAGLGVRARTGALSAAPASLPQAVTTAAGPAGSHRGSRTRPQVPALGSCGAPTPLVSALVINSSSPQGPVPHLGDLGLPRHPEKTGRRSGYGFYWRRLCHSLSWRSQASRDPLPGAKSVPLRDRNRVVSQRPQFDGRFAEHLTGHWGRGAAPAP